jgi:hypothetical protein
LPFTSLPGKSNNKVTSSSSSARCVNGVRTRHYACWQTCGACVRHAYSAVHK